MDDTYTSSYCFYGATNCGTRKCALNAKGFPQIGESLGNKTNKGRSNAQRNLF